MPIQLIVVDRHGPLWCAAWESLTQQLSKKGIRSESIGDSERPAPWSIFDIMRSVNIYPPNAVLVAASSELEVAQAKNAGAWAVGVTDASREMGLGPNERQSMDESERERMREKLRTLFLDAGADAVVDSIEELTDAIEAINGLM